MEEAERRGAQPHLLAADAGGTVGEEGLTGTSGQTGLGQNPVDEILLRAGIGRTTLGIFFREADLQSLIGDCKSRIVSQPVAEKDIPPPVEAPIFNDMSEMRARLAHDTAPEEVVVGHDVGTGIVVADRLHRLDAGKSVIKAADADQDIDDRFRLDAWNGGATEVLYVDC